MRRIVSLLATTVVLATAGCGGSGGSSASVSGTVDQWLPVDAGHGYALVTFTNDGTDTATVTCTVEVSDDFGDRGWDYIDITLAPGESQKGRVALTVQSDGAYKVNGGVVKECS
jgi:hypothetical protein